MQSIIRQICFEMTCICDGKERDICAYLATFLPLPTPFPPPFQALFSSWTATTVSELARRRRSWCECCLRTSWRRLCCSCLPTNRWGSSNVLQLVWCLISSVCVYCSNSYGNCGVAVNKVCLLYRVEFVRGYPVKSLRLQIGAGNFGC